MGRIAVGAMLRELNIRNLAIIDELQALFTGGLNVISGETGAGKSIIIGAVSLLLGDRASSDLIRSSEESAEVEALFDISANAEIQERLTDLGFHHDGELILRRVVSRSGKNRIYVNGYASTVSMLSSLSELLVNICGQHEHQILLDVDNHIDLLDRFGGLMPLGTDYAALFDGYQLLTKELERLKGAHAERTTREELLSFQIREIEESGIVPDEDLILQEEKKILGNAQRLRECTETAYDLLYAGSGSVLEGLNGVMRAVQEIREIDRSIAVTAEDLETLSISLEETAFTVRDYLRDITYDPVRLEEIDERLQFIGLLKRKYGGSIESILRKKEEISEELKTISSLEENIQQVEQDIARRETDLIATADELSCKRKGVARVLSEAVEKEIHSMRMENTVFEVRFLEGETTAVTPAALHRKGVDIVAFYLSTNLGEDLKPLNRIASGGELSRIVLAMKNVLAGTGTADTVIFDEVDSGIGGAAAEVVGEKLKNVADHHQVICITHLPQIACFGDTHFVVAKEVRDGRTTTRVSHLNEGERLDEIARMLGGVELTEKTKEHASEMLKMARRECPGERC